MDVINIRYKKFSEFARAPEFAHLGDACADLYIASEHKQPLWPGETVVVWTDLALEIPEGFEGLVRPRSGMSSKGIQIALGTIDSGYRGNVGVTVHNAGREHLPLPRGLKIAQLAIRMVPDVRFEMTEVLSDTERGAGGFGSSDAKS